MKKVLGVLVGVGVIALAACSKEEACTTETLSKKGEELTTLAQEALTKDPMRAAEIGTKVAEIVQKYQGDIGAEACKAYDEMIAELKK